MKNTVTFNTYGIFILMSSSDIGII